MAVAGNMIARTMVCLWYDKDAEAAARFYTETFPNSSLGAILHAPGDHPSGKAGDVLTVGNDPRKSQAGIVSEPM